jgi:hypothetical protein
MKSVLTFFTIILLPLSVWAMTPVSDSDLSNIVGQAGVSINPNLTMNIAIGTMAWGDADGINPASAYNPWSTMGLNGGGYIGINNFNISNLRIRLRTNDTYNSYNSLFMKPMTIDVATDFTTGHGAAGTTFVRLGLGAVRISMDELQYEVALGSHAATDYIGATPNLNQRLGVVSMGAMDVYVNPRSYVDVSSHSAHGVTFDVNVTLDQIKIPYISWGGQQNK